MGKPLCIDVFCGIGGWAEGFLAEGWDVIGFDIEQHVYGQHRYPCQLVIQDALTLHGSQFKNADCLVMSPPCQAFSYMSMPWTIAKDKAAAIRADASGKMLSDLTRLFQTCFRIQREASEAAGRHIPLVVENVRGAQPWVGRARWAHGSFYLWGDVPALMPIIKREFKVGGTDLSKVGFNVACVRKFTHGDPNVTMEEGRKNNGENVVIAALEKSGEGRKGYAQILGQSEISRKYGSKSPQRKMASAMIAKIPLPLSRHIARIFHP